MGVISWLADRFGLVSVNELRRRDGEAHQKDFEIMELRKSEVRLKDALQESEEAREIAVIRVTELERLLSSMEETAAHENELAKTAQSRVKDLSDEIEYLRGEVKIYQQRIGLLPQVRQAQTDEKQIRPLRKAREPFAVAEARIQAQRSEEYWRSRAAAVEAGTTGATSESTPTVSDKTND